MSCSEKDTKIVYTVEDWLFGCVNFSVPQDAIDGIFAERRVDASQQYAKEVDVTIGAGEEPKKIDVRLLKADLYKWIVLGPGKVSSVSDSDNGWSHSEGGYTLSKDDKKMLIAEANAIYEELEPDSVFGKKYTKIHSLGIMPAKRDLDGNPLPRIVR